MSGRSGRCTIAVVVAAALLSSSLVAGALSPAVGVEFLVTYRATANTWRPDVAWNGADNQYLVVWEDERGYPQGRYNDIYAQRLSATGSLVGSQRRISDAGGVRQDRFPEVSWNATSTEYLVVWEDGRDYATLGNSIYGQRLDADGTPLGANFRISTAATNEWFPEVAWNSTSNQYLVVWEDERNAATRDTDIYGQRLSASGAALGGNFRIGEGAVADDRTPAVSWNATAGQYLVVWEDHRNEGARGADIYGQRVSAAGSPVVPERRISGAHATGDEVSPAVAWSRTSHRYLVVWTDGRSLATRGTDIRGRFLSGDAAAAGGDFRLSGLAATTDETDPAVAWNQAADQFLVSWVDRRNLPTRLGDIYGQRVQATGGKVGGNFRVCGPDALLSDLEPAVGGNEASTQYLVVWSSNRSGGFKIFGRRVSG